MIGRFKQSVSLLTWGFNEELLVEGFLSRAFDLLEKTVEDFELVFVDDGSTDRTHEILGEFSRSEKRLRVITNPINVNVGISCRRAIQSANKKILFWQTVDWSYDLTHLRIFLELLEHYDIVQGIRPPTHLLSYLPWTNTRLQTGSRSDTFSKAVISLTNYYLLRILFGVPLGDFQNVTFYRTEFVKTLPLRGTTPFVNPEMLIRSYSQGARIIEVPISFIRRTSGKAKGTRITIICKTIIDIVENWISWGRKIRCTARCAQVAGIIDRISEPKSLRDEVSSITLPLTLTSKDILEK